MADGIDNEDGDDINNSSNCNNADRVHLLSVYHVLGTCLSNFQELTPLMFKNELL